MDENHSFGSSAEKGLSPRANRKQPFFDRPVRPCPNLKRALAETWARRRACRGPSGRRPETTSRDPSASDETPLKAYRTEGPAGLISKRRGRKPETLRRAVLAMLREWYWDFGPTLAAEKLREVHGIALPHRSSAEPSPPTPPEILRAVSCLIGRGVTF
jgi:hypothetical protein